ncbi:MAG TPA: BON domain-containing protein, partial [Burkholderiales bacterium]
MVERNRQGPGEEREYQERQGEQRTSGEQLRGSQSYQNQDRYGAEGQSRGQNFKPSQSGWNEYAQPQQSRPGYAQSYGGEQSYGQSQRGYGVSQDRYGQPNRDQGQGFGGYSQQSQDRYAQQRDYGAQQGQHEHDLPVYGSGRGPYAHLAGYGADSGVGPDNYVIGARQHEGEWHGSDQHFGPRPYYSQQQQRPSYGPYGQQQSQRDYGAWGAQGYGGEGGSGAQGYGGQGAYGRYGSQSDYGTPGGYGGDRIYRQSGPQQPTGGGARFGNQVSYGQGVYGGYGQGDMGTSTGQSGQSWGNWGQSGVMGRSQHRGPKGYQRSDERLKEEICERLITRWDIDSSEVSVEVQGGKVTLEGTVPDRRMRHQIEDLIDDCHGVQDIENRVRVQSSYGSTSSGSAAENRSSQENQT